ncbi:MAG: hypothetical protein COT74_04400 [Bdellovibrionales bacterium CG10_big_fil_rev_8_21_14_0_10_45_34]|nr:MAG: hypothetical protein COT74_04400 [Bdellovibrionales bacterium CG10_big_fil_rev_8_21_14_0_10_45_34]
MYFKARMIVLFSLANFLIFRCNERIMKVLGSRLGKAQLASLFLLSFSLGCSHGGHVIDELGYPLLDIQQVVTDTIPGGVQKVSVNRREYSSNPYSPKNLDTQAEYPKGYLAKAKVVILGDRRPYKVESKVWLGTIENKVFQESEIDESLSRRLGLDIQRNLIERREKSNLIDDFRPF